MRQISTRAPLNFAARTSFPDLEIMCEGNCLRVTRRAEWRDECDVDVSIYGVLRSLVSYIWVYGGGTAIWGGSLFAQ